MTTANDAWVWDRDYSSCNRRRLEEESATTSTKKKGVRGASHRRAQNGDDVQQGDGDFDSDEIKTSFRDDEEGVGDDIGGDKNDPFEYVPPGYDDIEYDAITDKSNEFKTSEREYDDEDDDIDGDKKDMDDKNKNNAKTCVPAVLPVARQSAALMNLAQVMEREPDLELLLTTALEPKRLYMAMVSYDDRQKAKDAGFRWDGEQRRWLRKMRDAQVRELAFGVREVAA